MRVLHLFKNYYPPTRGGVEQWINGVVHAPLFAERGISFAVLTANEGRKLVIDDDDGVKVVRAPTLIRASTAPLVPSWVSWIRRLDPDVIHVSMPNPTGELAVIASRTKAPIVATYHADVVRSGPVPAAYDMFLKHFLKRAHRIVVGSGRLAESVEALRGFQDRITIIPYGIDPEPYAERPGLADEIRMRYPGPLVLLLGRLVHYKGADVLVEAAPHINATILIVGDGPMREGAEARARELGITDRVRFIGEVPDDERPAYYHAADLFALPSTNRGESYGIVQVEAMATGTPSVSTELGTGTSWVNVHGETGLVVPPRDPEAFAAAVNELLADDERRRAMGEAAQRRVREHLSRDGMLLALRDLYEEAVSRSR